MFTCLYAMRAIDMLLIRDNLPTYLVIPYPVKKIPRTT